ncbi:MAG: hypothetical protein KIT31_13820 [Deltaproteobacteria bacterium]|nr:hypothetical protein [Deltaproteobacteria bacterium]
MSTLTPAPPPLPAAVVLRSPPWKPPGPAARTGHTGTPRASIRRSITIGPFAISTIGVVPPRLTSPVTVRLLKRKIANVPFAFVRRSKPMPAMTSGPGSRSPAIAPVLPSILPASATSERRGSANTSIACAAPPVGRSAPQWCMTSALMQPHTHAVSTAVAPAASQVRSVRPSGWHVLDAPAQTPASGTPVEASPAPCWPSLAGNPHAPSTIAKTPARMAQRW